MAQCSRVKSPSTSGAHSNTLPSAPPLPTITSPSVQTKTTDYRVPLKGATTSTAGTPSTSRANTLQSADILKEIRASNLILQDDLNRVHNLIRTQNYNHCNYCSFFIVVLLLITIGLITYHIFFEIN